MKKLLKWGAIIFIGLYLLGLISSIGRKKEQTRSEPVLFKQEQQAPVQSPPTSAPKDVDVVDRSYDEKRGSNHLAAKVALALVDLTKEASPSTFFDVYIKTEVSDNALKKYQDGGSEDDFRQANSFVGVTVVIDSQFWSAYTDSQKKDLLASWAKIMQKEFPKAGGYLTVNNKLRDVAEITWLEASYGQDPQIELK